jgi:tetratricopeptide (TPR) repeat protein
MSKQNPIRPHAARKIRDFSDRLLDRLAAAKEIAQSGAVIGREFSYGLLHALVGRDETTLKNALAQLEDSELVFRSGERPDARYTFKHALVQDTAYESLLKSRRQSLHRRIANILETQFPSLAETEPEILAHHFSRADLADPARLYYERAGDRAVARSANAEAVAHFESALAQTSRISPEEERNQGELAVLLKLGPAVAVFRGLQSPDLEKIYQRAYDIAKAMDSGRGLFKSVWGLWLSANLTGRTVLARDRAEELLALAKQSGEEDLILEAFHCRWATALFRGDLLGAFAAGCEGLKHYDHERHGRHGDEFGGHNPGACAHALVAHALALLGNPREAAASVERSLALVESLNHSASMVFALMPAASLYAINGDRMALLRVTERMIEFADAFNLPATRSIAAYFSGWANAVGEALAGGLAVMESEFPRASKMHPLPQAWPVFSPASGSNFVCPRFSGCARSAFCGWVPPISMKRRANSKPQSRPQNNRGRVCIICGRRSRSPNYTNRHRVPPRLWPCSVPRSMALRQCRRSRRSKKHWLLRSR